MSALLFTTSKVALPVLRLQPLRTNSNCLCFAYYVLCMASPMHTAVSWPRLHPNSVKSLGAYDVYKPYINLVLCGQTLFTAPKERVWDMVIKQLVAQVFNLSCKSSDDVSNSNCQSKICNFFALASLISTVFQLITSRHFLLSALLTLLIHSLLKVKFWIFLLIRYHVTEWLNTVLWLVHTAWCMAMNCSMAMSGQTLSLGAATQG